MRKIWIDMRVSAGCGGCCDLANHSERGASADRHGRSDHNIAAGCCVVSAEVTLEMVAASAGKASLVAGSSSSSSASGTGVRVGEREAGLTVELGRAVRSSSCWKEFASPDVMLWPSWELKSSWERVTGDGRSASNDGDVMVMAPVVRTFWSSPIRAAFCCRAWSRSASSSLLRFSRPSTSWRFRSREDWAARRFRSTRSTRRCSFSSSVLARFLSDC